MGFSLKSLVNPVSSLTGSLLGGFGNAMGGAANQGYDNAINAQNHMFDVAQGNLAPYRNFGTNYALPGLQNFVSKGGMNAPTAENVSSMPGYQFGLDQGVKGIENSALSRGGLLSGNAMRAISQYGQDYANSQWDRYAANNTNQLNNWLALNNLGQNAAAGSASNAMSSGNSLANLYTQQGNTKSQYQMAPFELLAGAGGMLMGRH